MTDAEILQMKLNLSDCALDEKGKRNFWPRLIIFMMDLVLEMK